MGLNWSRILLHTLLIVAGQSYSQQLDQSFNARLRFTPGPFNADSEVLAGPFVAETSDGGLLIYGGVNYFNGLECGKLVKLDYEGNSFPGFRKVMADYLITKAVELPNGNILINGGYGFTQVNGVPVSSNLCLLNADGTLNLAFQAQGHINTFAVQSDGRIITWTQDVGLQRLYPDGTLDPSFATSNTPGVQARLYLSEENDIYMSLVKYNNTFALYKFKPNGEISSTFSTPIADGDIWSVQPLPDKKVIVGGEFSKINEQPARNLVWLDSTGSIIKSPEQTANPSRVTCVIKKSDNNILIATSTSFNGVSGGMFELTPEGEQATVISQNSVEKIIELRSGKILVTGQFTNYDSQVQNAIAMLNPDYSLDSNFKVDITSAGNYSIVPSLIELSDDKLAVAAMSGSFGLIGAWHNGKPINNGLIILDQSGYASMPIKSTITYGQVNSIAKQEDGKILIGGVFWINSFGSNNIKLCRLHPDGSYDSSFTFQTEQLSAAVYKVLVRGSQIYVSGRFNTVNGTAAHGIVVVDLSGNIITTFPGIDVNTEIYKMEFQGGKLIVASRPYAGNSSQILRLNLDGTIDNTFTSVPVSVSDLDVDEKTGKIYCLPYIVGPINNAIARLNADGSVDPSFQIRLDLLVGLRTALILPDRKIALGGDFTEDFSGQPASGFFVVDSVANIISTPAIQFERHSFVTNLYHSGNYLYASGKIYLENYTKTLSIAKIDTRPNSPLVIVNPSNLRAQFLSESVKLNWVDNSVNEDGFIIDRSNDSEHFNSIDTVATNTITYLDTAVVEGVTYDYRVAGYNTGAKSSYATGVSVNVPLLPPEPPSQLKIANWLGSTVLTWSDNSENEWGFIVERAIDNQNFDIIDTLANNQVTLTDTTVDNGSQYTYRTFAFRGMVRSHYSNVADIKVKVLAAQVPPPYPNPSTSKICVELPRISDNQINLSLIDSQGAWVSTELLESSSSREACLNLVNLPIGIYFLRITVNGNTVVYRVIQN